MLESKTIFQYPPGKSPYKRKNLLERLQRGVHLEGIRERLGSSSTDFVILQATQSFENKNVRDSPSLKAKPFSSTPLEKFQRNELTTAKWLQHESL